MANKKKNIQLGIDLQVQNYESAIKALTEIEKQGGSVGKAATRLRQELEATRNSMVALGSTTTPQELKKFIKVNADLADALGDLGKELKVTQEQVDRIKKDYDDATQSIKNYQKELEKAKQKEEELNKAQRKKHEIAEEKLKDPANKGLSDKLAGRKDAAGKWKKAKDLADKGDADAIKFVQEVDEAAQKEKKALQEVRAEIKQYEADIKKATAAAEEHRKTLNNLKQQYTAYSKIRESAEEASESINENNEALIRTRDAAVKAGEGQIKVSKATDETTSSFTKAARSVFNYTVLYQGFKKVLRESVRTIKEMDDAITGMTVVTNLSRDEAWKQVDAFQAIAKATSSTMTEIAGLTTEYLKQGRAMKDAKILAEETAKSAKIAGISTAEAVQYMTSAINGFNLAASDATRVSDVFANLAAASATDFEDLAIAVSKVSAQANLAGMSLEYTTALLAKGIETTQEAPESIGTALKTIVARMRELSSYGSVLEDGASVNKVERALASAGIELRDVNGEFRDLEEIFNELGPKWDYLNTMQQQAIAQAVAGTRQQSRFVAIMQDWGRTQELIAEANASEGASAAQYEEYANGIEAALSRMKTSWEGFVQDLANNKVILAGINAITKILEVINVIPKEMKAIVAIYLGIVLLNRARENHEIKMKAYRQMAMTDEEKAKQAQGGVLKEKLHEQKIEQQNIKILKAKLELAKKLEEQAIEANDELGSLVAENNLEVIEARKKLIQNKLDANAKEPDVNKKLPREKELMLQEELNRLTKLEEEISKNVSDYKLDKEQQRKAIIEEIANIDKKLEIEVDVENAVKEIESLDQQIADTEKSLSRKNSKKSKEKLNNKLTQLKEEREKAVNNIDNLDIDDSRKEEIKTSIDKKGAKSTLEDINKNKASLENDKKVLDIELDYRLNDSLTMGTEQWKDKLKESEDIISIINKKLEDESLTEEQKLELTKQRTEELAKQEAIQAKLKEIDEQKDAIGKDIGDLDKGIEAKEKEIEESSSDESRIQLEKELQALKDARMEKEKELEALEYGALGTLKEKIEKQKELNNLKNEKQTKLGEVEKEINDKKEAGEEIATDDPLLEQQKNLKQEILLIDTESSNLTAQIKAAGEEDINKLEMAKQYKLEEVSNEEFLQQLKANQLSAEDQALIEHNDQQIKKLEGINEEIELRKQLLELELASLEAEEEKFAEMEKNGQALSKEQKKRRAEVKTETKTKKDTLKNLGDAEKKNLKTINKLQSKNQKIQDGSYNTYKKMADLIGQKLGFNIAGMVDNVKTVANFAKQLYTDFGKLIAPLWTRKKAEEEITEEKKEQNLEEIKSTGTQTVNTGLTKVEGEIEEDISEEKKEQTGEEIKEGVAGAATLITTKGQETAEKNVTKEKKKGFFESLKNAIANISSSAGQPYGMGLPFALAGLALLAIIGVGASIALGSAGAGGDAAKEQKIAAKQNANYEMKKSNTNARNALSEYEELSKKEFKTEEDKKRLEELETEMQELDESFAGLRGDALVKAVRGRVAAQEIAIEDNIKDSFDTALSMDDINGSSVAQQAIADKIVSSQEKLIASNADLIDATQEEVDAVKNNAADMASELSKQMDWNSYGSAHDYNAWDYVGAAAGTLLLGATLGPIGAMAGTILGGGSIGAMIEEDKAAEAQQRKMEADIATFERASVEMATDMATADKDLASQVAAFDSGMAELTESLDGVADTFKQTAKEIVKEQYGTIAYVSEMNAATNGELLKTISRIQDKTKGTVTEDAMIKMADAVAGSSLEDQKLLEKLQAAESTSFGATSEGWAFFSGTNQSQDLDRLRENLKDTLGDNYKNATINEVKEALVKQIKRNDDGTLMVDENGNYAFKDLGNGFTGNNKELTEIYNNVANLSEELGDFANLTSDAAGYLTEWTGALTSSKELLMHAFETIDENLYSNEMLLSDKITDSQKEMGNAGYAFARAAQETADTIKRDGQKQIDNLNKQLETKEVGSDAYNALKQAIDKIDADMNKNAAEVLAQAKQAVGYLADSDWLNRIENLDSKRDNVQEIREALLNKEELSVEQTQRLWNEIIPDLQKVNPSLGYGELKTIFDEQGLEAIGLLSDYLDNFKDNSNLIALNSVGSDLADVDYALKNLTKAGKDLSSWGLTYTTDKDGDKVIDPTSLDKVDQQAIADEIKAYKDANDGKAPEWADEFATLFATLGTYWSHKDQMEASQVAFEREAVLTADEIKRANLEAKIAAASEDTSKHRLSVLELEIDLHKQLADELAAQVAKKQKIITDDLTSMGVSFDEIFEVVNGQVIITADKYDKLSDDVKEYITSNLDAFKEIVAAEYEERKAVIDGEQEKFDEIISLQETFIDAYKTKLEKEQEAVEETLDKRKDLYQEYFDWLNDQEDQDETENDIEILRQRIANLSGATDAASLKAYKDAVEELEDLEKESIQSEQEKIQEQILENLDKQSDIVEEYYDKQLEDNQKIIDAINNLAASEDRNALLDLLKTADDYDNLTAEQQLQKDKEYAQLLDGWGSTKSTSQAFYDWWAENPNAPYDQVLAKRKELLGYSEGGLVDYTGLAMVHGSSAKPEAFLNAEQTALFAKLGEILMHESSIGQFGRLSDISANTTINNNLTIENFDITINADMKEDQDIYNAGQGLADVFFERIQASGIPVNIKK